MSEQEHDTTAAGWKVGKFARHIIPAGLTVVFGRKPNGVLFREVFGAVHMRLGCRSLFVVGTSR